MGKRIGIGLNISKDKSNSFFYIHSSHRQEINGSLRVVFLFAVLLLVIIGLPAFPSMHGAKDYLPVHMILEAFSVVIASLIFAIGWNAYSNKLSASIVLLAVVFLGTAILDFSHILSYKGMPDFITPNGVDKGINFWLAARLLAATGILLFCLFSLPPLKSKVKKLLSFIVLLLFLLVVHWLILFRTDLLPQTFIEGQGLTEFKVNSEYLIIAINILSGILLWRRMREPQAYHAVSLFTAVWIMAMSEFYFTLYLSTTDLYNLSGHIYKVFAYYFVYKAIFVTTVQIPYKQLDESQKQLNIRNRLFSSIVNTLPNMVFLKDAKNLRYALFNKAGEKLIGINRRQILGKTDYSFFDKKEAESFEQKDREALASNRVIEVAQESISTSRGIRTVHTKKVVIKDEKGRPEYLLGISEDITDQVAANEALRHSESTLRASQGLAGIGSYVFDLIDMKWSCSDMLYQIFGIDQSYEISARSWVKLIHPDDRSMVKKYFRQEILNQGEQFNLEYRIIRENDHAVAWVHGVGRLDVDESGRPLKMIGTIQDITSRKEISESLATLSLAVEQSPSSIVITDLKGSISYVNAKFTEVTGYSEKEAFGKNPRILKSGKTDPIIYEKMWRNLCSGKAWQGELINRRKDGSHYIESVTISPVKQPDGSVTNYVAIKQDITEEKKLQEHIETLAHYDQLTGLPNRALLNDRVSYLLSHAKRASEKVAVMFLDLDHFKNINDTLGHNIGDLVLVEVAERLKNLVRSEDTVSRLGGDEFILIFSDTDEKSAMHIVHKIIETISVVNNIGQYELTVTPSIGIAIYPYDGDDFDTLLKNADAAMYQVKKNSRNGSQFFTEKMHSLSVRNLELTTALRSALKNNELEVYYQPQSLIEDGSVFGAEALLRWKHPEMGFISPVEFIPIAEESGLIIEIGGWVLKTVLAQIKLWKAMGLPEMVIAVNLSSVQFRQEHFAEKLSQMIEESGVLNKSLELELTEAVAMHNPEYVIGIMNDLHAKGIRMAIDDFGTGYSSLSYLKQFNAHKLKIDQSFVRELSTSSDDRAIVSAIINMAKNLGMKTIAEGVETEEQLSFLRTHGCNEIQGYIFSKAITADEFTEYVIKNRGVVLLET